MPHFVVFTHNCRPTQYMYCQITLYLHTPADHLIICTATFHFFTDNCSPTEYIQGYISFYIQADADQVNICTVTFHCIYR